MRASTADNPARWVHNPGHRRWLADEAATLFAFFERNCVDSSGGFHPLDHRGLPRPIATRDLVQTARMVHCFSVADLLGRPHAARIVEHGLAYLRGPLRDDEHGGWHWTASNGRVADPRKQAYGHAFVLLAASSALQAGFDGAQSLVDEVTAVLEERFWSPEDGLYREEFSADWQPVGTYRGGNSNMHMTEALLAAYEATADRLYLDRAKSVADRLINRLTRGNGWRLAEHYTAEWSVDAEYGRGDPRNTYRPFGSVVGHSPEWSRLLLCLAAADPDTGWYTYAARTLFDVAVRAAWDARGGGLAYTLDFTGHILDDDHYQWPISEAIGAACLLGAATGEPIYESWYRTLWRFAADHLIDRENGGWHYVLGADNAPKDIPGAAEGKPDLYHALQSCLIPLFEPFTGVASGAFAAGSRNVAAPAVHAGAHLFPQRTRETHDDAR
jgi:mannose/cellobiose epimerase-like protein (N-acyl-D-glucosamine 2-epimerase family)